MAARSKTTDGTRAKTAAAPAKGRRARAAAKDKPPAKPRTKEAASETAGPGARRPAPVKGRRAAVVAGLSSVAIVAALVAWSQWGPRTALEPPQASRPAPPSAPAPSLPVAPAPTTSDKQLLARIGALEAKLAGLETAIAGTGQRITDDAGKTAAESSAAIEGLARRLGAVEGGMATAAGLAGRIEALETDLQALRRAAPGGPSASRGVALLLGAVELRDALGRGAPFAAEITALEQAFAGDRGVMAALASLSEWAPRGVPSHDDLARRLERLAPRLLRAAKRPADGGWIEETWARISALVVIRPTGGDVVGDKPGAVLARAEAKLALGDLDGAAGEVERLRGPAAAAAGDWLAAARARLGAKAAIAVLSARAADLLGGRGR
jgi:hypothetical protein